MSSKKENEISGFDNANNLFNLNQKDLKKNVENDFFSSFESKNLQNDEKTKNSFDVPGVNTNFNMDDVIPNFDSLTVSDEKFGVDNEEKNPSLTSRRKKKSGKKRNTKNFFETHAHVKPIDSLKQPDANDKYFPKKDTSNSSGFDLSNKNSNNETTNDQDGFSFDFNEQTEDKKKDNNTSTNESLEWEMSNTSNQANVQQWDFQNDPKKIQNDPKEKNTHESETMSWENNFDTIEPENEESKESGNSLNLGNENWKDTNPVINSFEEQSNVFNDNVKEHDTQEKGEKTSPEKKEKLLKGVLKKKAKKKGINFDMINDTNESGGGNNFFSNTQSSWEIEKDQINHEEFIVDHEKAKKKIHKKTKKNKKVSFENNELHQPQSRIDTSKSPSLYGAVKKKKKKSKFKAYSPKFTNFSFTKALEKYNTPIKIEKKSLPDNEHTIVKDLPPITPLTSTTAYVNFFNEGKSQKHTNARLKIKKKIFLLIRRNEYEAVKKLFDDFEGSLESNSLMINTCLYEPYRSLKMFELVLKYTKSFNVFQNNMHLLEKVKNWDKAMGVFTQWMKRMNISEGVVKDVDPTFFV